MGRGQITRHLPNNEYLAALAANAASAANPFATIADLDGVGNNWADGDLVLDDNRVHDGATFNMAISNMGDYSVDVNSNFKRTWTSGANAITEGIGVNPTGFEGAGGAASWFTTAGNDAYSGSYGSAGDAWITHTVYGFQGLDESGMIVGKSSGAFDTYAQLYHWQYAGSFNGFEANEFGERILSQSSGLNRLSALNAASGIAFLSGAGATGYIGVSDQDGFISWMGSQWPTGGDGNGIFDAANNGGTVPTAFVAKLTDSFTFNQPDTASTFNILNGTAGNANLNIISDATANGEASLFIDSAGANKESYINFANGVQGIETTLGWDASAGRFKMGTTALNTGTFYQYLPSTDESIFTGSVGIGNIQPGAAGRLVVRGTDTSGLTRLTTFENSIGQDKLLMQNDGQFATGSGTTASHNGGFGQTHRTNNYAYGVGYYLNNASTAGLFLAMQGTTRTGISVSTQNSPVNGTVVAVRGTNTGAFSQYNYGMYGIVRDGSIHAHAVYGQVTGGFTVTPTGYVAAVAGNTAPNIDTVQYGAYLLSNAAFAGAKTKDIIGVYARASNQDVITGSTSKAIAAQFLTNTDGAGTFAGNIALHVPFTGNDGSVVFGADAKSANATFVEIHNGDLEIVGANQGFILTTADGTQRYKYTATNATGALTITLLP